MFKLLLVDEGPIRDRLLKELTALSVEIAHLETNLDKYFSRDLPQYQAWVNERFADELVQITSLEKKVQSLGHHVEESIQISMKMNMNPQDLFADWTEEKILEKIFSDEEAYEPQMALPESSPAKECASIESKEIFRKIARSLHPDLRGQCPCEGEKNLWVKAQKAYSQNDLFELMRIEESLKNGDGSDEPVTCFEMIKQVEDYRRKFDEIQNEMDILQSERAWDFSEKRSLDNLECEISLEYSRTLKDLKTQEQHFQKTLRSWLKSDEKTKAPQRKRNPKSQVSLF